MPQTGKRPWGQLPASLHEDVFTVPSDFEDDKKVLAARSVLMDGRVTAERAKRVASEDLANEFWPEVARHKHAGESITKLTTPALQKFDKLVEAFGKDITGLEEELQGPKAKGEYLPLRMLEVRQALSGMDVKQRRKVIGEAIKAGDDLVVAAVLRAAPFLTSISSDEQEHFRLQWQQHARPHDAARLAMLRSVQEHVYRGGKLLLDFTLGLTDQRLVRETEERMRRAREAEEEGTSATLQ